jgi:hypothetical protein
VELSGELWEERQLRVDLDREPPIRTSGARPGAANYGSYPIQPRLNLRKHTRNGQITNSTPPIDRNVVNLDCVAGGGAGIRECEGLVAQMTPRQDQADGEVSFRFGCPSK